MDNIHTDLTSLFSDIANAIKYVSGKDVPITADYFPDKIYALGSNDELLAYLGDETLTVNFYEYLQYVTAIGEYAAMGVKVSDVVIPTNVKRIENHAFGLNSSLKSVIFEGVPEYIDELAFIACSNLTTINVPWAEGAVAKAPWGATNATINYNYTGGSV